MRHHHAKDQALRGALDDALVLLESVPVYLSRIEPDKIDSYLEELSSQLFPEMFLTIRHEGASGNLTYRFLLDDEYIESREDELVMLIATFALIILIVLALNISLKGVIGPLGEIRTQTGDMAAEGELKPLTLSKRPDNEINEIVDNLNKLADKK